ncbi:hypothetical protein [Brevundimonas sp. PAMC22021]|uniref:hypothetical protein n=1 Tax=Brevundimonas sp. PAMC22021 TaxID=2861285 RepID=UPI001C63718E|nr:hypothetical protein [Brevundimonas sp. PAMC22021]QYF87941.1 hypothetical protein KY493_05515 [Brevundimonas sp. PAMC22021]
MKIVRIILMLMGVASVLSLGAVAASAAPVSEPPCHQTEGAAPHHPGGPASEAPRSMKVMGCCVACIAASPISAASPDQVTTGSASTGVVLTILPSGRSPAPAVGPPRLLIV